VSAALRQQRRRERARSGRISVRPDLDQVAAAARFLDAWHRNGAPEATLVAIHPETRAIQAATFDWPGRRDCRKNPPSS
jgi:hypothetical protein